MISDGTSVLPGIGLVGNVEKRWTKLRGSWRSCSARVNVGYLYSAFRKSLAILDLPLFDKMIQSSNRLCIFQILGQAPFTSTQSSRKLLCERLVFSKLDEKRFVQEVLDIFVVVE